MGIGFIGGALYSLAGHLSSAHAHAPHRMTNPLFCVHKMCPDFLPFPARLQRFAKPLTPKPSNTATTRTPTSIRLALQTSQRHRFSSLRQNRLRDFDALLCQRMGTPRWPSTPVRSPNEKPILGERKTRTNWTKLRSILILRSIHRQDPPGRRLLQSRRSGTEIERGSGQSRQKSVGSRF